MPGTQFGAAIVSEARSWIGTPYRHQASLKGIGCDCLGLVRGVWRHCIGTEPESPPPYAADWAEARGEEALADAARRHLVAVKPDEMPATCCCFAGATAVSPNTPPSPAATAP